MLYESEINVHFSTFWDGGYSVKLGDDSNGFSAESTTDTFMQAVDFLVEEALKRYPDSLFAAWHGNGMSGR
jgi:hypothetical protein